MGFQFFENFADGPVDFLDRVAPFAIGGYSGEILGGKLRRMGHSLWEVEEEGLVLVLTYPFYDFTRVALGDEALIRFDFDDVVVAHER